jgi:hypothetical protein
LADGKPQAEAGLADIEPATRMAGQQIQLVIAAEQT